MYSHHVRFRSAPLPLSSSPIPSRDCINSQGAGGDGSSGGGGGETVASSSDSSSSSSSTTTTTDGGISTTPQHACSNGGCRGNGNGNDGRSWIVRRVATLSGGGRKRGGGVVSVAPSPRRRRPPPPLGPVDEDGDGDDYYYRGQTSAVSLLVGTFSATSDGGACWSSSRVAAPPPPPRPKRYSSNHDPNSSLLVGTLLHRQSRRSGGAILGGWRWRHVVLNVDDGSVSIYKPPRPSRPSMDDGGAMTSGDASGNGRVRVTKRNRCRTQVLLRGENRDAAGGGSGGRRGRRRRGRRSPSPGGGGSFDCDDDVDGRPPTTLVPDEDALCIRLPRSSWAVRDAIRSEKIFAIEYDPSACAAVAGATSSTTRSSSGGGGRRSRRGGNLRSSTATDCAVVTPPTRGGNRAGGGKSLERRVKKDRGRRGGGGAKAAAEVTICRTFSSSAAETGATEDATEAASASEAAAENEAVDCHGEGGGREEKGAGGGAASSSDYHPETEDDGEGDDDDDDVNDDLFLGDDDDGTASNVGGGGGGNTILIYLKCPGGGNEKALWLKLVDRLGRLRHHYEYRRKTSLMHGHHHHHHHRLRGNHNHRDDNDGAMVLRGGGNGRGGGGGGFASSRLRWTPTYSGKLSPSTTVSPVGMPARPNSKNWRYRSGNAASAQSLSLTLALGRDVSEGTTAGGRTRKLSLGGDGEDGDDDSSGGGHPFRRGGLRALRGSSPLFSRASMRMVLERERRVKQILTTSASASPNFGSGAHWGRLLRLPPRRPEDNHWSSEDEDDEEEDEAAALLRGKVKEYRVRPSYAYLNQWMTKREMELETNRTSAHFHDLRPPPSSDGDGEGIIGSMHVEVLQCLGLPKLDRFSDTDAVAYLVLGQHAFCTDVIDDANDPMWPRLSRRACTFPLRHPYARLYAGVFDDDGDFAGRVSVDVSTLRPDSVYDAWFPLRKCAGVTYSRKARGAVRLRFSVEWPDERAAVLSYLSPSPWAPVRIKDDDAAAAATTVRCGDKVAFRCVALTVHGSDMHGRFSRDIARATSRELALYKVRTKALARRTFEETKTWTNPAVSSYVFVAWMRCTLLSGGASSSPPAVRAAQYTVGFLVICLLRNYARRVVGGGAHAGFAPLTIGEIVSAVIFGGGVKRRNGGRTTAITTTTRSRKAMKPLEVKKLRAATLASASSSRPSIMRPSYGPQSLAFRIFAALGFFDDNEDMVRDGTSAEKPAADHAEFPFSDGAKYPKMSLEESLVVLSPSSSATPSTAGGPRKIASFCDDSSYGVSCDDGEDGTKKSQRSIKRGEKTTADETLKAAVPASTSVPGQQQRLGKPYTRREPEQNIDVPDKKTKTILEDLQEVKELAHKFTGGVVHDRVFTASRRGAGSSSSDGSSTRSGGASASGSSERRRLLESVAEDRSDRARDGGAAEPIFQVMERRLGIGMHRNPVLVVAERYAGPMVQIMRIGLSAFRATFNLFMWKDPFLSSWFLVGCLGVIFLIGIFPWRICFSALGFVLFGPQNWVIRKWKLGKPRPPGTKLDCVDGTLLSLNATVWPSKSRVEDERLQNPSCLLDEINSGPNDTDSGGIFKSQPFMSHYAAKAELPPNSGGGGAKKKKVSEAPPAIQEVVVPYSPLRQERFYDWPPLAPISRVTPNSNSNARSVRYTPSRIPESTTPAIQLLSDDDAVAMEEHSKGGGGKSSSPERKQKRN